MKKSARVLSALLVAALPAMTANHPVPKNRMQLRNGDCFAYVVGKLGPLEWWSFASSPDGLRREDYPSDWVYDIARRNTWDFPRFCFSLFRPKLETITSLTTTVNGYSGDVYWWMNGDCIRASASKPAFTFAAPILTPEDRQKFEDAIRNPPRPDPDFVKRAMVDIPKFCQYLEDRLGLQNRDPIDFNPQWLTREGLVSSRGEFEEFVEPGTWSVFLTRDPSMFGRTSQPTSPQDRLLNMGISDFESSALFRELGADWKKYQQGGSVGSILPQYPLLSRLDDITSDALYQPDEVPGLLAECVRAQAVVNAPASIRGLDKLVRIARWAQELNLGIYFGGQ